MKKSLFGLCLFVFVAFLSVVLPAYILLSGSATLMPLVKFGAVLVSASGAIGLLCTGILTFFAVHRKSVGAHRQLVSLYEKLGKVKAWRESLAAARTLIQIALLLALGQAVLAGFVVAGFVGVLLGRGLIHRYIDQVTPFKVDADRVYINSAFIKEGTTRQRKVS